MRLIAAIAALALVAALPVLADPPSAGGDGTEVTLLDGWRQPDGSRVAAIAITVDPDAHTYWRVPGEAGFPPSFDWSASRNLAAVRYEWPRPEILDSYGMQSFGYVGALVLPVLLTPRDPTAPMDLALSLSFGVCAEVCSREDSRVEARLTPDAPTGDSRARIEAALAERARTAAEAGVARVTCSVAPGPDGYELTARVTFATPPGPRQIAVLETSQQALRIGEATSETDGKTVVARAPIEGGTLDRSGLRVTVLDDTRAVDIRGCASAG